MQYAIVFHFNLKIGNVVIVKLAKRSIIKQYIILSISSSQIPKRYYLICSTLKFQIRQIKRPV